MIPVTHALYRAAGRPPIDGDNPGMCRVCGHEGQQGQPFDRWVKPTFTDHDKLYPGTIVCQACLFSFEERSEQLAQIVGKGKPQRMRNYSHFVADGVWLPLSKGDKPAMLDALRKHPDVAVIATSGQKHVIFRAQPGMWQLEESAIAPDMVMLEKLLGYVEELYFIFSKEEIYTGRYRQNRIRDFGVVEFLTIENQLKTHRGSAMFELAIFLSQKGDKDERLSRGVSSSIKDADSAVARNQRGLQAKVRPQYLGPVRKPDTGGGVHKQCEQVYQQSLFPPADTD